MDIRVKQISRRLDWRTLYRFGFYHYGPYRVFRIGKLCIFLWEIK